MNKPYKIAVIDYRMSNMFSIQNALNKLGLECEVTCDRKRILASDGAILPGVGSFPEAMNHIKELELDNSITSFIDTGKPFLGICLGFQLLYEKSEEIKLTEGLGVLSGKVENITNYIKSLRVPHIGWNSIKKNMEIKKGNHIDPFIKTNDGEYFYFVHSCFVNPDNNVNVCTTTEYAGFEFCSSILYENVFACQFHPEKSGVKGFQILKEMFSR